MLECKSTKRISPKKFVPRKQPNSNVCNFCIFSSFLIARCSTVLRLIPVDNFACFNLPSNIALENLLKSIVVIDLS